MFQSINATSEMIQAWEWLRERWWVWGDSEMTSLLCPCFFQCATKVMDTNQAWAPLFKSLACFWQLFGAIFLSLHVLWPISGHRSQWIRTQCPPSDAGNPCTLWQQISTPDHNKTHICRLNKVPINCFACISSMEASTDTFTCILQVVLFREKWGIS